MGCGGCGDCGIRRTVCPRRCDDGLYAECHRSVHSGHQDLCRRARKRDDCAWKICALGAALYGDSWEDDGGDGSRPRRDGRNAQHRGRRLSCVSDRRRACNPVLLCFACFFAFRACRRARGTPRFLCNCDGGYRRDPCTRCRLGERDDEYQRGNCGNVRRADLRAE